MDIVFIEGLELPTIIGVYDWERLQQQTLLLDMQLGWDHKAAAVSDDIEQALDYAKVAETVCQFAASKSFFLLEALIEQIAELLMTEFNIPWVKLSLTKPNILPNVTRVGVSIERGVKGE